MTISEFIESIAQIAGIRVEVEYVHPTLYILCVDSSFEGMTNDARLAAFCGTVNIPADDVESVAASPMIELALLTERERQEQFRFLVPGGAGTSWLSAFAPGNRTGMASSAVLADQQDMATKSPSRQRPAKAVHFYGYKGGQGRSTVLVALAKVLADAGYRVLTVDADIEAPSLDAMFGVGASDIGATLMGLSTPGTSLTPLSRTYVGASVTGYVDLVSARPVAARFDMDFAAFLLNTSMDASVLELAVAALRQQVEAGGEHGSPLYDIVLFDHRTGLAPSVLPIMEAWPGSAVIFVRPDGMARHILDSRLLDTLLAHDPESPGAFVSFSLDPKKTAKDTRSQSARFIEGLLGKIAEAMQTGDAIDPQDLDPYWVFWRHDQSFVDGQQPNPRDMSTASREAIGQLRSVLGLSGNPAVAMPVGTLTSSGSTDDGKFILTPGLAKLFSSDSPYTYVFGRKGTGKTRLLSELVRRNLAEPLLVANDSRAGGLPSANRVFQSALAACNRDFEKFWWFLLSVALSTSSTRGEGIFEAALQEQIEQLAVHPNRVVRLDPQTFANRSEKRVFVIDGVETAVPASDLRSFVEALFRFLAAVQFDRTYSKLLTIRLLLRTDLATGAAENVEQQIEGSALYLHWNKTTILNFALARIVSLPWFQQHFADVCKRIDDKADSISHGALPDDDSESLLLDIFPAGLERNRLKTTTFFASYFSDAGGDAGTDSAFYPRLFDGFLRTLADNAGEGADLVDNRLSSKSVLLAYDQASKSFISDVRTELYSFLNIESNIDENRSAVNRLIAAFDGLQTPFSIEEIIETLAKRTNIPVDVVRRSLTSMQKIGMFEPRAGYPGELRARQLYKAGLGMKYVRKKPQE
ncbi:MULTISPECIES: P-loop NTPase [Achromobacter]|uniref:nucleotide-binding protein n=1 Tax=Achromobacter TaxID=222 RepID=UPI0025C64CB5|nr:MULTISPECIES: P-loop NTPase [Achromobacter]